MGTTVRQTKLTTLDVGNNKIDSVPEEEVAHLTELEEFWVSFTRCSLLDRGRWLLAMLICAAPAATTTSLQANDNALTSLPPLSDTAHPNLTTIYLEHNPVQKDLGGNYHRKIMLQCPQIRQIDAVYVNTTRD